jgi:hypothetical protein
MLVGAEAETSESFFIAYLQTEPGAYSFQICGMPVGKMQEKFI